MSTKTAPSYTTTDIIGAMDKPGLPYVYRVLSVKTLELDYVAKQINEAEKVKQTAYERACKVQSQLVNVRNEMEMGDAPDSLDSLEALEKDVVEICNVSRRERDGNTSAVVEEYLRAKSFWFFIKNRDLMPHSAVSYFATDEEYLGACMGLCQDLARYGMMVAITRDLGSIRMARDLCSDILENLLDYDFSNNYLKRRFEDAEYAHKTLETIMYEVTMTTNQAESEALLPVKKRAKLESTIDTATATDDRIEGEAPKNNIAHLQDVYIRMERRDNLQKKLIKQCSTVKRSSRKTIFYLHRKDGGKAYQHLSICESTIRDKIQSIIDEESPLKAGTYTKMMEDYAEAKLFYAWMFGRERTPEDTESALLKPEDFPVEIDPATYVMALTSMTGEISRFAMQARTERDFETVKHCLATCAAIAKAVLSIERSPLKFEKRISTLKRSVGRLERFLYEMSLQTAAGGQKFISETSVIGSSSLMPNSVKRSGTKGSAASRGASMNGAVPDQRGASNFPGLDNPYPKHGGIAGGDEGANSTSSESEDSGHMRKTSRRKHELSSDSSTSDPGPAAVHNTKRRVMSDVIKNALQGTSIPMTLEVKNKDGDGTDDIPMSLSVTGTGDNRTLSLSQDTRKEPPPSS